MRTSEYEANVALQTYSAQRTRRASRPIKRTAKRASFALHVAVALCAVASNAYALSVAVHLF